MSGHPTAALIAPHRTMSAASHLYAFSMDAQGVVYFQNRAASFNGTEQHVENICSMTFNSAFHRNN
jgi:hypothetical protein